MYRGGTTFSKRTEWVIRIAGIATPVLLVPYGLLARANSVDHSHYAGDMVFLILMTIWFAIALRQFMSQPKSAAEEFFRLSTFHILSGAYILLVSGFTMPFIAAWILLLYTSYSYFSNVGVYLSAGLLVIVGFLDVMIGGFNTTSIINNAIAIFATISVGLTVVAINKTQEVDNQELIKSKALESLQRDRILTLINNLADAVLSTDKDGVVQVYNAASLNLLDTNAGLNGQNIDDIIHVTDTNQKRVSLFDSLKNSHGVSVRDDLLMTIDGEAVRLEVTYSPIKGSYSKDTKRTKLHDGYVVILRDITKAKSLEEERDEFISVVSHELRTPITVAEGTISNVQVMMDRPNISQSMLKNGIATAHQQVVFLAKMVNDLSTLSRAERGVADEAEVINVRHLVDDLYNEYAPQAEKKGLHLNLDLSSRLGSITASPLYLKEILQNFLTNALKYTKEGAITLRVVRHDDRMTFEIKDSGIGISKSDQAKIFNKFYRSEDYRTRETGGTGLGLYVASKLAKKLNTKIKLSSRLNHGSTFGFDIFTKE